MATSAWVSDLAAYLATQSIGTVGTSIFIGQFPVDTTEGVLLIPTGGLTTLKTISTERPTVQVTTRYKSFATGWAKSYAIYALLNQPLTFTSGANRFFYSRAIQPPFSLGQTDRQLCRIVNNYQIWLT
jgi:hypothetical protein